MIDQQVNSSIGRKKKIKMSTEDLEKKGGLIDENTHAVPGVSFEVGDTIYAKLQRWAGKLSIEQRGIERVCIFLFFLGFWLLE